MTLTHSVSQTELSIFFNEHQVTLQNDYLWHKGRPNFHTDPVKKITSFKRLNGELVNPV